MRRNLPARGDAMMETPRPRRATITDAEEINAIYNYYVRTSTATFQVDDETTEDRAEELRTREGNLPFIVLEIEGTIVGWGALSRFRSRCAYRDTTELTTYVRSDRQRQGYGRVIVQDLLERAQSLGYHTILAACCKESVGMIRTLESLGFGMTGELREVGCKFGRRLDVAYLQLLLPDRNQAAKGLAHDSLLRESLSSRDPNAQF